MVPSQEGNGLIRQIVDGLGTPWFPGLGFVALILTILVLFAIEGAFGAQVVYIVGADTTWTGMSVRDTTLISALRTKLLDTVEVFASTRIDTAANLSRFNLIVLSRNVASTTGASLLDTAVGVVTMERENYDEFNLAAGTYGGSYFTPSAMMKEADTHWLQRRTTDSGYISSNNYLPGTMTGLCAGAQKILNMPRWLGTDTSMYFVVDKDSALTTGVAAERRVFLGQFNHYFSDGSLPYSKCRLIETFLNACKWASYDTLNNGYMCFAQGESPANWIESSPDSQVFVSGQRIGFDFGKSLFSLMKIDKAALSRKWVDGWDSDSMVYKYNVYKLDLNTPHQDTLFDISTGWYRLTPPQNIEWTLPKPGEGGNPAGNGWANRYSARTGASLVNWTITNLQRGVDYENTRLAYVRINKTATPVGTIVNFNFGAQIFDTWANDTSTCRGLIWKPDTVWTTCDSCDIEFERATSYQTDDGATAWLVEVWSSWPSTPRIAFSPDSLVFTATAGQDPADQITTLWNSAQGMYACTLSVGSAWLTATVYNGGEVIAGENNSIVNSISVSGLSAGTYYDTVTITAGAAQNTPQYYQVSLIVSAAPPPGQLKPMSGFLRAKE